MVITSAAPEGNALVFANATFTALTGYELDEVRGRNCRFLQGADTDRSDVAALREAIGRGASVRRTLLNYKKDGTRFWSDLRIDPIRDDAGTLRGFVAVMVDDTASHEARAALRETELQLQSIARFAPGYVYRRVLGHDGIIDLPYVSSSINRLLGMPEDQPVTLAEFISHVHPDDLPALMSGVQRSAQNMSKYDEEFRLILADGSVRWFRSYAQPRRDSSGEIAWDGLALDITEEKAAKEKLEFLAFHDPLTGLANRDQFRLAALHALALSVSARNLIVLLMIDLDSFQDINDTGGIAAGDAALQMVGERLMACARRFEGTAARVGGDEFAILLADVPPAQPLRAIADYIAADLAEHVQSGSPLQTVLQVCIGAAVFPFGQSELGAADVYAELVKRAELALHAAKQIGPGSFCEYSAELDDRLRHRKLMRLSLQRAIAERQFELHYQPIVELHGGRIVAAEALVRWKHPELGFQRPDLFIPLAESSGLIVPLGAWIMREAMRQGTAWKRAGAALSRIAINVSAVELKRPEFIGGVEQALAVTGADPAHFEFELTEGILIDGSQEVLAVLNALKQIGFRITIDDFGTGYSSFKYVRDFHVDKIKIDQTFVRQLVIDSKDAAIVRAMIALSRDLGIEIVAEGIETVMQRDFLRDAGCEIGQGYFFSMPLAADDFGYVLQNVAALPMQSEQP